MNTLNTFDFTTSIAAKLTVSNSVDEINSLLSEARNDITLFEAMDEWTAEYLNALPTVANGNIHVKYDDDRGYTRYKEQSLSESFWVIALKQVQYHTSINYDLLQAAFANWINDNVYMIKENLGRATYEPVTATIEQMLPVAKTMVEAMQVEGLVRVNLVRKVIRLQAGNTITTKVFEITAAFTDTLNELIDGLRDSVSMKCRPLTHQPQDWTDMNTGVGEGAGLKLVARAKVKTKVIDPRVLGAVNKLQHVKFTVADCIAEAAHDMMLNVSMYKMDTYKGMFSDKELNKEGMDVFTEIGNYQGKEFYFPVTMDARGRMYYRGGLLTPQGTDFCKAAFQFADMKPLGEHGLRAICIHTANVCGMDKLALNDRQNWVQTNWSDIMGVRTHMDIRRLYKGASVFQALVACRELQRLAGLTVDWSERESNLVCHMDGTCNGLQHTAAITGDRKTAESVNCTESTHDDLPQDVYGLVATTAEKFATGTALELIKQFGRGMAKGPVMVLSYGASESTLEREIYNFLLAEKADVSYAKEICEAYVDAINSETGAVTQLTEALTTRVQLAIEAGQSKFTWRTADGFLASTQYLDDEALVVRVGTFHTRKRHVGKAILDSRKSAQAMTPNFVHSIDAAHLRMVVTNCEHDLVTVHDSIGSHPCDYFETAKQVRSTFAQIHSTQDSLADLCNGMKQPIPTFPRVGDYQAREALKSAYIFS